MIEHRVQHPVNSEADEDWSSWEPYSTTFPDTDLEQIVHRHGVKVVTIEYGDGTMHQFRSKA